MGQWYSHRYAYNGYCHGWCLPCGGMAFCTIAHHAQSVMLLCSSFLDRPIWLSNSVYVFMLELTRCLFIVVRLFMNGLSANMILIECTLMGFVYWGNLFYVPVYLQNIHGYSPIISGAIILPMVACHGVGSAVSGMIISRTGHYNPVLITSIGIWTIGVALQTLYTRTTPVWAVCVIGFLQGIGIGGCFQRKCAS